MQTRTLSFPQEWILFDKTYQAQMALKRKLLEEQSDLVVAPGKGQESTEKAKMETLQLLVKHLLENFPSQFELCGDKQIKCPDGVVVDLASGEDPFVIASRLVQEDFCLLEYDEEEKQYVLTAGVVAFPMRWSLLEKMNQPMTGIHGPVTAYLKHLQNLVADVFRSMKPGKGVKRGNWAIFNDLHGPLDLFTPKGHAARALENQVSQYGPTTGEDLLIREEYQTLLKLPETQAILFTIRTYQRCLSEMKLYPKEDSRDLIAAIETLNSDMAVYKGAEFWKDATLRYLAVDVLGEAKL